MSARAVDTTFTTTVYTDERGEFFFPSLLRGKYRLWAQATGYETARAEVELDDAGPTRSAFALNPVKDSARQLRGPEWLAALPEETFEDRRMKEIFRVQCTECHQPNLPLQNRFDERGWLAIISAMEKATYWGLNPANNNPPVAMRYHKAELAKYLARMRGPGPSPLKFGPPLPRPTGDAARVVITEYDVPPADTPDELVLWNGEDWSEGTPSGQHGGRSGLHDVAIDSDGNAWITTWGNSNSAVRLLVRLDTKTGNSIGYNVAKNDQGQPLSVFTHGITADRSGSLWFNAGGKLGKLNPAKDTIEFFTPPVGLEVLGTLDVDKTGRIWAGAPHGALQFDPETKTFKHFQDPTLGGGTYGVAVHARYASAPAHGS
jgi:hypothetical protein